MLSDRIVPNRLRDTVWLRDYLQEGSPAGPPILLSLGEPWSRTPQRLLEALPDVPTEAHGYQLSMWGLPVLRNALRTYVALTHQIDPGPQWELAVSWTGTRSAMRDFGEYVLEKGAPQHPEIVVLSPAWDYAGVFEPLGYASRYLETAQADGFAPCPAALEQQLADLRAESVAIVVINAQHNPTGHNWSPAVVRLLLEFAHEAGAAVLIDDAYFAYCDPALGRTSAIAEVLALEAPACWLATRSLGKEFNCNGWALGALTAPPQVLDVLVNDIRPRHSYNYAGQLQAAMAAWLARQDEVTAFLQAERTELAAKRAFLVEGLVDAAVPRAAIVAGRAAPYVLFDAAQLGYANASAFLERAARTTGVVMTTAWPTAQHGVERETTFVRIFAGVGDDQLREAWRRLREAEVL